MDEILHTPARQQGVLEPLIYQLFNNGTILPNDQNIYGNIYDQSEPKPYGNIYDKKYCGYQQAISQCRDD